MNCEEFRRKFKAKYGYEWDSHWFYWNGYRRLSDFVMEFNEYFDCWWDPTTFDYWYVELLLKHCSKHFLKWWNPEKFDWDLRSPLLAKYCPQYFLEWWDPKKFSFSEQAVRSLFKNCRHYKHIWYKNAVNKTLEAQNEFNI